MNRKRNTDTATSADYEAQVAAIIQELEANRMAKLRVRATEILRAKGVRSPEDISRRKAELEAARQVSRHAGLSYVDEAPGPWASLPVVTRPGGSRDLRVKPTYGLTAEGVTVRNGDRTHFMASPIIRGEGSEVWAYVPGPDDQMAWTTLPVPIPLRPADVEAFFQGLQAAGVTLGTGVFQRGQMQPTPAWQYLVGYILDGTIKNWG